MGKHRITFQVSAINVGTIRKGIVAGVMQHLRFSQEDIWWLKTLLLRQKDTKKDRQKDKKTKRQTKNKKY